MKSILEEFANGNIDPLTQFVQRDSEHSKLLDRVCACEEKLSDSLGKGDKDLLEKYIDAQGDLNQITATEYFIYGYKLGVLMTAEVYMDADK